MKIRDLLSAAGAIAACEGVGAAGSAFTIPAVRSKWYHKLRKPSFNPPNSAFGPIWNTLYALMGLAYSKMRTSRGPDKTAATGLFGFQLFLNWLWNVLFFRLRSPLAGFVELIALVVSIATTAAFFWRISKMAAVLLLPYLAWTAFAAVINGAIVKLNRK